MLKVPGKSGTRKLEIHIDENGVNQELGRISGINLDN